MVLITYIQTYKNCLHASRDRSISAMTKNITLNSTLLKLIVFEVNVFPPQRTLNILRKFAVAKHVNVNM
jgi:hypothetical protein